MKNLVILLFGIIMAVDPSLQDSDNAILKNESSSEETDSSTSYDIISHDSPTVHFHLSHLPNDMMATITDSLKNSNIGPEVLTIMKTLLPYVNTSFSSINQAISDSNDYLYNTTEYLDNRIDSVRKFLQRKLRYLDNSEILHTLYHISNKTVDFENSLEQISISLNNLSCPHMNEYVMSQKDVIQHLLLIISASKDRISEPGSKERQGLENILNINNVPRTNLLDVLGTSVPHVLDFFSTKTKLASDVLNTTATTVSDVVGRKSDEGCKVSIGNINCNCKDREIEIPSISSNSDKEKVKCECNCDYKRFSEEIKEMFSNLSLREETKLKPSPLKTIKFDFGDGDMFLDYDDLSIDKKIKIQEFLSDLQLSGPVQVKKEKEIYLQRSDHIQTKPNSKLRRHKRGTVSKTSLNTTTSKPVITSARLSKPVISSSFKKSYISSSPTTRPVIEQSVVLREVINNVFPIEHLRAIGFDNITYYHNNKSYKTRSDLVNLFLSNYTSDQLLAILNGFNYTTISVPNLYKLVKIMIPKKEDLDKFLYDSLSSELKDFTFNKELIDSIITQTFNNTGLLEQYYQTVQKILKTPGVKKLISENYVNNSKAIHLLPDVLDIYFIDNKNLKFFLNAFKERYSKHKDKGFIVNNLMKLEEIFTYGSASYLRGFRRE